MYNEQFDSNDVIAYKSAICLHPNRRDTSRFFMAEAEKEQLVNKSG